MGGKKKAVRMSLGQAIQVLGEYGSVEEARDAFHAVRDSLQRDEEGTLREIAAAFGNPNPRVFNDVMRSFLLGQLSNLPDSEVVPFLNHPVEYIRRFAAHSLKNITPENTNALLKALREETSELAVRLFLIILAAHWVHYLQRGVQEQVKEINRALEDTAQKIVQAEPFFGVCFLRFVNPPLALAWARKVVESDKTVASGIASALWMFWNAPGINNQDVLDVLNYICETYGEKMSWAKQRFTNMIVQKETGEISDTDAWVEYVKRHSVSGELLASANHSSQANP